MNQTRTFLLMAWLMVAFLLWREWGNEHTPAATPAPVFVWRPEATSGRVRTFIESLQDSGRVRTLDDAMAPFACTPLRETARISALVRERLAL